MLQISATADIYVVHSPVSFHNGIDGHAAIVRELVKENPMDGAYFVFTSKSRRMLRILFYDGGGYWLATKRLSQGCFHAWPGSEGGFESLELRRLQILLWGGHPGQAAFPDLWRKVG